MLGGGETTTTGGRVDPTEGAGGPADDDTAEPSPLAALDVIGVQDVQIGDELAHLELFTLHGLLTVLWHGPRDAEQVAIMGGGAMGGLLGPADGLYHDLGEAFAERGIATLRIG